MDIDGIMQRVLAANEVQEQAGSRVGTVQPQSREASWDEALPALEEYETGDEGQDVDLDDLEDLEEDQEEGQEESTKEEPGKEEETSKPQESVETPGTAGNTKNAEDVLNDLSIYRSASNATKNKALTAELPGTPFLGRISKSL